MLAYYQLVFLTSMCSVVCVKSGHSELKSTSITYVPIGAGGGHGALHGRRVRRSLFTKDDADFLTDDHNAKRRMEQASDMEHMKWNYNLADMALEWAQRCVWEHGQPARTNPPFKQIGQNLYATTADLNLAKAMEAWSDNEKVYYHYDTGDCDKKPCGHYTQVVWSTSKEVGCAIHYCPILAKAFKRANYLVCNYGPAGNIVGVKPFKLGRHCTKCTSGEFFCDNKLCRSKDECSRTSNCTCEAQCLNSGCADSDCKCVCQDGFTGPNCADKCEDKHANCGANPGWPEAWCNHERHGTYVQAHCPRFCGICRVSTAGITTCPSGTHSGVIINTSSVALYWPQLWSSLEPVVISALINYCKNHALACCHGRTLQTGDSFIFNKENVIRALTYPHYGRYEGKESTEILVYITVKTVKQQCSGDLPQQVLLSALQAVRSQLNKAVSDCCNSQLLGMVLGETKAIRPEDDDMPPTDEAPKSNTTTWVLVVLFLLLVGGGVAIAVGYLYWKRQHRPHFGSSPNSIMNVAPNNRLPVPKKATRAAPPRPPMWTTEAHTSARENSYCRNLEKDTDVHQYQDLNLPRNYQNANANLPSTGLVKERMAAFTNNAYQRP